VYIKLVNGSLYLIEELISDIVYASAQLYSFISGILSGFINDYLFRRCSCFVP
jgi:hypothetical protein